MKTIQSANYDQGKRVLAVNFTDGTSRLYHGSVTVWKEYPSMKSCSSADCAILYEVWSYCDHFGTTYKRVEPSHRTDWVMVLVIFVILCSIFGALLAAFFLNK